MIKEEGPAVHVEATCELNTEAKAKKTFNDCEAARNVVGLFPGHVVHLSAEADRIERDQNADDDVEVVARDDVEASESVQIIRVFLILVSFFAHGQNVAREYVTFKTADPEGLVLIEIDIVVARKHIQFRGQIEARRIGEEAQKCVERNIGQILANGNGVIETIKIVNAKGRKQNGLLSHL